MPMRRAKSRNRGPRSSYSRRATLELLALTEPCAKRLLCRASDYLLIGTRIANHLPQGGDARSFLAIEKILVDVLIRRGWYSHRCIVALCYTH